MQTPSTVDSVGVVEARFGAALREERKQQGLSQKALAEKLTDAGFSIDGPGLSRLESKGRSLRLGEAKTIADVLGVPLEHFIGTSPKVDLGNERFRANRSLGQARTELANMAESCLAISEMLRAQPDLLSELSKDRAGQPVDEPPASPESYLDWVALRASRIGERGERGVIVVVEDSGQEVAVRALLRAVADGVRIEIADDGGEGDSDAET